MTPEQLMVKVRLAAVAAAEAEWKKTVRDDYTDPKTGKVYTFSPEIIAYHEDSGAAWPVADGYQEAEDFWCGVFAAYCYSRVGDFLIDGQCVDLRLKPEVAKVALLSTTRLNSPDRWEQAGVPQAIRLEPEDAEPGDLLVFRTGRTGRPWGDHITVGKSKPKNGEVELFEGNAWGTLGDGSRGEGVVVNTRKLAEVARAWRLRIEHLEGAFLETLEL